MIGIGDKYKIKLIDEDNAIIQRFVFDKYLGWTIKNEAIVNKDYTDEMIKILEVFGDRLID